MSFYFLLIHLLSKAALNCSKVTEKILHFRQDLFYSNKLLILTFYSKKYHGFHKDIKQHDLSIPIKSVYYSSKVR